MAGETVECRGSATVAADLEGATLADERPLPGFGALDQFQEPKGDP